MSERPRVLVVDDEPSARAALCELLRDETYDVRSAADGFKALGVIDEWTPDVILTDLKMPGLDGVGLMEKARALLPDVPVVVMTAFGSVESAVEAMHRGANDYMTKPVHFDQLLMVLSKVLEHAELHREAERLRRELAAERTTGKTALIGQSKAFRKMMAVVEQVASSDVPTLVTGDAGTGAELVARALHDRGDRASGPFVSVACGALSADVLLRELMGYASGAVPGTSGARAGAFERAAGGTLVLEDVGSMPAAAQVEVARVLGEGVVRPIGDDGEPRPLSARVIATATGDLQAEVSQGRVREDLYYRLNVVCVRLPSLRERREDIPLLAAHFLEQHANKLGKKVRGFGERALGVLLHYEWPGNVTQLENCVQRAVALARGAEVEPRDLPREMMGGAAATEGMPTIPGATLYEIERFAILRTLEEVGGSTSKAAKILGISPRKIQYRLNEYREVPA